MATAVGTEFAVPRREDLEPWQRLNVTALPVSGLGTHLPDVVGERCEDAGNRAAVRAVGAVRAVPTAGPVRVGLAVHGPRKAVDKALRGARLHP